MIIENKKYDNIYTTFLNNNYHLIFYGKYLDFLYDESIIFLNKLYNTKIKSNKKIQITNNNNTIPFVMSEYHYEIDFNVLGVNEISWFMSFFYTIQAIPHKKKIIICKNFVNIKHELLSIFHLFLKYNDVKIILLTDNISYINESITRRSLIIPFKLLKTKLNNTLITRYGENTTYQTNCDKIIEIIKKSNKQLKIYDLREQLYGLLIHNYDIITCFKYIIFECIKYKIIREENIIDFLNKFNNICMYFNNNHRTIFHMENFIINIIKLNSSCK